MHQINKKPKKLFILPKKKEDGETELKKKGVVENSGPNFINNNRTLLNLFICENIINGIQYALVIVYLQTTFMWNVE